MLVIRQSIISSDGRCLFWKKKMHSLFLHLSPQDSSLFTSLCVLPPTPSLPSPSLLPVRSSQLVHMILKKGMRTEEGNSQETGDRVGRASSEYCDSLKFIIQSPCIPQSKGKGKRLPFHDSRDQQASLPCYISKLLFL